MVSEHGFRIQPGMLLKPNTGQCGRWHKSVTVTRVDRLSGLLDLVAAEYSNQRRLRTEKETAAIGTAIGANGIVVS